MHKNIKKTGENQYKNKKEGPEGERGEGILPLPVGLALQLSLILGCQDPTPCHCAWGHAESQEGALSGR